jgi:hypothetical protein
MPCTNPIPAVRDKEPNKNGKFPLIFSPSIVSKFDGRDLLMIPCGRCISCRLKKSSNWAFRMMCEKKTSNVASFITLTFSPENLKSPSLDKTIFRDFLKRLREGIFYNEGKRIRFYHCGEYGDLNRRPHYHAIIFGYDFPDRYLYMKMSNGFELYRSDFLESKWPFGFASVADVTFESCAYVARYVTKKITGDMADEHYKILDEKTGELIDLNPEYATMSLKPGIGYEFFQRFYRDIYPKDFMVFNNRKVPPPPYFDDLLAIKDPDLHEQVKMARVLRAESKEPDDLITLDRINQYYRDVMKQLKRKLEL